MSDSLILYDADTLLSTPVKQPTFLVEGLIPRGLSILSGAAKIGKSWLMMWLALCVASGMPLWGLETRCCDVLYLCLEDTRVRIQNRLYKLIAEAPPSLRFATACGKLGDGLEEQIAEALTDYPATELVIIDTLQKVRSSQSGGKSNMYANDYDDITHLKELADHYNIAILLVHHLRKQKDNEDPFNEVSGSTGITGAADTNLILKRKRGDPNAVLQITGRDVEEQKLILRFEKQIWNLVERKDSAEIQREEIPKLLFRITEFMSERREWSGTATELLEAMQETETSVNVVTKQLGRFALEVLAPVGIRYSTKRTGNRRLIFLQRCDGYDGNDSKLYIAERPSLLSQPSFPGIQGLEDDFF